MSEIIKAVGGAVTSLFGGGPDVQAPPPPPTPEKVTPMPTPDDEETRRARRLALATAQTRGGRASTILTGLGPSRSRGGTLGGGGSEIA